MSDYWTWTAQGGVSQGGDNSRDVMRERRRRRRQRNMKDGTGRVNPAAGMLPGGMTGRAAAALRKRKQKQDDAAE